MSLKKSLINLFLLFTTLCIAQNKSAIDSLKLVIKTSTNDSVKMATYNKLRYATCYSDAKVSKDYAKKYLEYAQKAKDSHNIVLAHFFLGNANVSTGNYNIALNKYLIAANYYEQKKDSKRLTSVFNSLGAIHEKTKNDSLSLHYYLLARKMGKSLKDYRRSGIASINIGNIYNNKNDNKEAIFYLEDAVKDLETNKKFASYLLLAQSNLATVYVENLEFNKATNLYETLLKKVDTVKDVYGHAAILSSKSNLLFKQNKFKKAMPIAERAYQKFKSNNFTDEQFQMIPKLISIYKKLNKNKKAVILYDEYTILKDSILSAKQDESIADAVQKYESDKKDTQLKVLALETEKIEQQKQLYFYLFILGLLIASLVGFFLYKNNAKNKALAVKNIQIKKVLADNEVLLKETHHRVKNSLQMISSLLYLQSENIEDEKAAKSVKDGQIRVKSMALIHQKLYQTDNLTGVEVSDYVNDLAKSIFQSHNINNEDVELMIKVDKMILDIDTITPIGIIINELIVNALKHAFTNKVNNAMIKVSLHKKENELILTVADNGKGFEPKRKKEKSFGLKLINSLSRKLKADLKITNKNGSQVVLKIKQFTIK